MAKNIMDILGNAATSKSTKKKDEMPVVDIGKEHAASIAEWHKRKKEETTAESLKKKEEEKLKPAAVEARKKWCLEHRKAQKSIKIRAGETELLITAAFQQKYSTITTANADKLQEIFGNDYERCFRLHTEISLTDDAMQQVEKAAAEGKQTILDKVMKAVGGPEEFVKLFSITQTIKPTDALDQERISNEKVAGMAQQAIDEGILKPQAPSFSM